MKLFRKILIIAGGILAILVVAGFFLPSRFTVERSIVIKAPARVIFDYVNDLEKNGLWSPWNAEDPSSKTVFGPVKKGKGAWYTWKGDRTGEGKLEIVESHEFDLIRTELTFGKNQKAEGYYKFIETAEGVKVIEGFNESAGYNIVTRYFGLFMDSMLGPYFEKGLKKIKELSETEKK